MLAIFPSLNNSLLNETNVIKEFFKYPRNQLVYPLPQNAHEETLHQSFQVIAHNAFPASPSQYWQGTFDKLV
jgi:hypothetical protein